MYTEFGLNITCIDRVELTTDYKDKLDKLYSYLDNYDYILLIAKNNIYNTLCTHYKIAHKKPRGLEPVSIPKHNFKLMHMPITVSTTSGKVLIQYIQDVINAFKNIFYHKEQLTYNGLGNQLIHSATKISLKCSNKFNKATHYKQEIDELLKDLSSKPILFIDIETTGLDYKRDDIFSIGFAWDKHNGAVIDVYNEISALKRHIYDKLRDFFINYQGKMVFHKANFDVTFLIYHLFMLRQPTNLVYALKGIKAFQNIEDTMVISYVSLNSCQRQSYSLKHLAKSFAGNWAIDATNIINQPLDEALTYNIIDCLCTAYVYEEYYPKMLSEGQENVYLETLLPTLKNNIRMQLHGLTLDIQQVRRLDSDLFNKTQEIKNFLDTNLQIQNASYLIAEKRTEQRNAKLKVKETTVQDNLKTFNYNSTKDLAVLVQDVMQLPIHSYTPKGNPKLDKKSIKNLTNTTDNSDYREILAKIVDLSDIRKMRNTFLPAFKRAISIPYYNISQGCTTAALHGYFNVGTTVSGRMSSSNVNLQQLPSSGAVYAKATKECFVAIDDNWLFVGIDFNSLEDRISALTTKDSNKLKVYLDGYDGHCLRAYYYFKDQMPDIDPDNVESINSIAQKYPKLRQRSKEPTFLLTYGGSYIGLMENCGFSEEEAKQIEANYHQLYKESDEWIQEHIKQACKDGYITTGFGLKLRTPTLKETVYNQYMGKYAQAEARTAGNALGQGWGVLNDRARNATIRRIDEAGHSMNILPVAAIHDANYYMVRKDPEILHWFNQVVVEETAWQEHPLIKHDKVHLSGELEIFYPNWSRAIPVKPDITLDEMKELFINKINYNPE